ncbi:cAMP-responsive element modulator isoform X13 [Balaenoptera acutorostrata]|uniref:cAMP-responsive element modulator n=2 Tax=Balaenoptera TaxID=9766 RepID=A0A8B8WNJ1_BALMU|nr:cAMP-responsive element modulator isoform X16 [Balaenoptera musculus]XP_057398317.1 cAMP-responsive element modulator isoform X13 [Balaenoptera acutorostrata]
MSKCGRKKYIKTNLRQMTMETIDSQQDGSIPDSVAESESAHMQTQTGQNSIPTLAQVSVAGSGTGRGSPAVTLVQLPSGQTVHVQGVFQTPQPSVIQSPQIQAIQVATIAETDESAESERVIDFHKRREILSRRPSYRKILNELSSDVPGVPKIEEEKSEEEGTSPNIAAMALPTSIYQTSTGQYTTTGDMPTYQIRAPTTALPQGVMMAASPGSLHSPQQLAEEATRKRELRLMKNREAAKECRRRKKEYVKCLESRVAVLEVQNKKLIEELETLKDICSPKTD